MLRKLSGVLALTLLASLASAKEHKGTATKLDSEKKTITIKVDDVDQTFAYSDTTEFVRANGKVIDQTALIKLAGRFGGDKAPQVSITTEEKDGKEVMKDGNAVATKVAVGGGKKKKNQ
jgi:hypothetical protein